MLFTIRHLIRYRYDRPIFPEPHLVRMCPRSDAHQRLVSFDLRIAPDAAGRSENIDLSGGSATMTWFETMTEELSFEARSVVETGRVNPFDFILPYPWLYRLPLAYPDAEPGELAPFLALAPVGPGPRSLIDEVRRASNDDTLAFPTALVGCIHDRVEHIHRYEPGLLDHETVLVEGKGACRDMAALFVTACRAVGIAARFVSGYQAGMEEEDRRDLHGWAEIYFPGGGWRGYDPAAGIACGREYVALASASTIELTAPVTGFIRGDAEGVMSYEVSIETEERD